MLRLILILFFGIIVAVGVLAIALYRFFGVEGLIAFPFVMLVFLWVAKILIRSMARRFALSLFGMKARVLRGATMNVHSIKVVPKPAESELGEEDEEEEDPPLPGSRLRHASARQDGAAIPASPGFGAASGDRKKIEGEDEDEDEEAEANERTAVQTLEKKALRDYVELDVTITPKGDATNRFWEPSELILTSEKIRSLADLEEKSIGATHTVEVWDGAAFGPDDDGKYPGEQRLRIVFEVKPGTKSGWLCYYHEAIGQLELPVGTVEV